MASLRVIALEYQIRDASGSAIPGVEKCGKRTKNLRESLFPQAQRNLGSYPLRLTDVGRLGRSMLDYLYHRSTSANPHLEAQGNPI